MVILTKRDNLRIQLDEIASKAAREGYAAARAAGHTYDSATDISDKDYEAAYQAAWDALPEADQNEIIEEENAIAWNAAERDGERALSPGYGA